MAVKQPPGPEQRFMSGLKNKNQGPQNPEWQLGGQLPGWNIWVRAEKDCVGLVDRAHLGLPPGPALPFCLQKPFSFWGWSWGKGGTGAETPGKLCRREPMQSLQLLRGKILLRSSNHGSN